MSEISKRAEDKLNKEYSECAKSLGRCAAVMAPDVLKALVCFIGQDEEFADAVLQNSQTFGDCMKKVEENAGSALSDLEAYRRAVRFYFPGAEIEFCMRIHVNPFEVSEKPESEPEKLKTLSLLDLL